MKRVHITNADFSIDHEVIVELWYVGSDGSPAWVKVLENPSDMESAWVPPASYLRVYTRRRRQKR